LPKRFTFHGADSPFYFRSGGGQFPSVLFIAFIAIQVRFKEVFVIASLFLIFFLLCYFPKPIYPHLPGIFTATQFTFRLLPFLSLIGAFALCLYRHPVNIIDVAISAVLMTLSQLGVIFYPMPYYHYTESEYLGGWEVNAFLPHSSGFRIDQNGELVGSNTILVSRLREITGAQGRAIAGSW
jgi:hypothetical protein